MNPLANFRYKVCGVQTLELLYFHVHIIDNRKPVIPIVLLLCLTTYLSALWAYLEVERPGAVIWDLAFCQAHLTPLQLLLLVTDTNHLFAQSGSFMPAIRPDSSTPGPPASSTRNLKRVPYLGLPKHNTIHGKFTKRKERITFSDRTTSTLFMTFTSIKLHQRF